MSAAGPGELDHVLFPAIARLAAGLLERHAQHRPADRNEQFQYRTNIACRHDRRTITVGNEAPAWQGR